MPPQFRRRPPFDSADDEDDDDEEDEDEEEENDADEEDDDAELGNGRQLGRRRRMMAEDHAEDQANQINDELKYGAGHRSLDSNPVESQSEWSDDECREEATGKGFLCDTCVDEIVI